MSRIILIVACAVVLTDGAAVDPGTRIVRGSDAKPGQFPYQVSLRYLNQHFCGGSIINRNTVLTAAHCLVGKSTLGITVVAGATALDNVVNSLLSFPALNFIVHESYNNKTIENDVALIKIVGIFLFGPRVNTVPLADVAPPADTKLTLSGWGLTSYPNDTLPNNLQFAPMRVYNWDVCKQNYTDINPVYSGEVCAVGYDFEKQGACKGDSGGPLVKADDGHQVGIVSWGIACAKGYPDVYTSVAFYKSWIEDHLQFIV